MTAFGRGTASSEFVRVATEITSVNRRHLEVHVQLPSELLSLEIDLKRLIAKSVTRGSVTLRLNVSYTHSSPLRVVPNLPLVGQLHQACQSVEAQLNTPIGESLLKELLSRTKEVWGLQSDPEETERLSAVVFESVEQALAQLIEGKVLEGQALCQDFIQRIESVNRCVMGVVECVPQAMKRLDARLRERFQDLFEDSVERDERLLRVVSLLADKELKDIEEEVTRLRHHCSNLQSLLHQKAVVAGKKVDFILQEMHREVNTIGSKGSDVQISTLVVEMKSEIERMREQVQNVE